MGLNLLGSSIVLGCGRGPFCCPNRSCFVGGCAAMERLRFQAECLFI
jgi:hypothetical protein